MVEVFPSLQRQNHSGHVVHEMALSIMRGDFKPGDMLASEPELSLQFDVSRPVMCVNVPGVFLCAREGVRRELAPPPGHTPGGSGQEEAFHTG